MKIFVYNQELKIVERLNYSLEDFKKNPSKYYPNWKENYLTSEKEYLDPQLIKIEAGEIKEKTPEELKIEKIIELVDGEIIRDGKVIVIEAPEGMVKKKWDKETGEWKEEATKEEIDSHYYQKLTPIMEEILKAGYRWIDGDKVHIQRINTDILTDINSRISVLSDRRELMNEENPLGSWAFDDAGNDTVMYPEALFRMLRIEGEAFMNACYTIRTVLIQTRQLVDLSTFLMVMSQPMAQIGYPGNTDSVLYYNLINKED